MKLRRAIAAASALVLSGTGLAYSTIPAHADAGCQTVPWGFLGSQKRTICDAPLRADGSWDRTRTIWWPSYWVRGWCSGSYVYMSCTPGYWMPPGGNQETYPVTADTVLPDEPGHLSGIGV